MLYQFEIEINFGSKEEILSYFINPNQIASALQIIYQHIHSFQKLVRMHFQSHFTCALSFMQMASLDTFYRESLEHKSFCERL
jgi:hypothetical protein